MAPRMIIIAVPPGSGKSTLYPTSSFEVASFNADDRAAELNGGSYTGISSKIRQRVSDEFDAFVRGSIERRVSFAIETTLRSEVAFVWQNRPASWIEMRYLALRDFATHLERVKTRADAGGHSAPEARLLEIYKASLANLKRAVQEIDILWVYDNTDIDASHPPVLEARQSEIRFLAENPPKWLKEALNLRAG